LAYYISLYRMNQPPGSPNQTLTRVLASVIYDSRGRMLICQRPANKRHGLLWEFPGGKIEPGESNLEAARRELLEELGVEVLGIGSWAFSVQDPGSEFLIEFYPVRIRGTPLALEHAALQWVLPPDLLNWPLAPSDRRFAEVLLSEASRQNGASS
jgi:8-oxo-dGTP diphosphatase